MQNPPFLSFFRISFGYSNLAECFHIAAKGARSGDGFYKRKNRVGFPLCRTCLTNTGYPLQYFVDNSLFYLDTLLLRLSAKSRSSVGTATCQLCGDLGRAYPHVRWSGRGTVHKHRILCRSTNDAPPKPTAMIYFSACGISRCFE